MDTGNGKLLELALIVALFGGFFWREMRELRRERED